MKKNDCKHLKECLAMSPEQRIEQVYPSHAQEFFCFSDTVLAKNVLGVSHFNFSNKTDGTGTLNYI